MRAERGARPASQQRKERAPTTHAHAEAGVLVSMLAHVAAHRYGFEGYGIATGDLQVAMTNIVYVSVTGQRAPEVRS